MGHSVGEYVAAHVAGVFSLEDGLKLIAARGRLMQALPREGEMAAVFADEARVAQAIQPHADSASIAAVNGPDNVVISGARASVQAALRALEADGIKARRLNVSHAFHSPLIEPMLDAFERVAGEVTYAEPQLRLISNVTGKAAGAELMQPAYWRRHARAAVQFESSMQALGQSGCAAFLEIGPNPTLTGMGQRCLPELDGLWLPSLRAGRSDWQQMLDSLAALYLRGANPDWASFDRPYPRRRLALPTYPYQRERYWIDLKPQRRAQAVAGAPQRGIDAGASHPLLGQRLRSALTTIQYESQLDTASPSLLDDHRVFGTAVLPAAATVEMALAAANTSGMRLMVVEDLVIHEALTVPEGQARICQTVLEPESALSAFVKVFSLHEDGLTWQLHASGKACATQRTAGESVSLAEIQARCPERISADEHYRNLADHGLDFGPGLRGVRHIWRRHEGDEALAEVRLPEPQAAEIGAYLIHPALLDACLQAVAAALPADYGTYLPVHLERFEYFAAPGAHVWSHARLRPAALGNAAPEHGQARETITCDVRLLDDAGQTVAEVIGLHLKHAEREALRRTMSAQVRQAPYEDWLYEIAWQPKPLGIEALAPTAPGPDTQTIVERMRDRLPALSADRAILAHDGLIQELERLSVAYITNAFEQLGWSRQPGERVSLSSIASRLGVTGRYHRLLARLLEILEEEGILSRQGAEWRVEQSLVAHDPHADWSRLVALDSSSRAELTLIGRCGPQLAGVLRGEVDPLQLLFPNGSFEAAEQLYQASPFAQLYNSLAREAVSAVVAQWPTGRALRVLEIGAGTGGTTSYLLPILPAETTEYWFTDISPLFTARAQEKFAACPFVRYQTLDIEQSPVEQGLAAGQFDLIVAANVIHATTDLKQTLSHVRQLLAPGGLFAMIEVSARQRWVDITFGLTDGWWRFTDDELRPAYPLLGVQQWLETLAAAGFAGASALPGQEDAPGILSRQAILLARGPQAESSRQQYRPTAPGAWLILADAQGVGRQLAAALETQGQTSLVASAGPAYRRESDRSWQLNAAEPGQFSQLLSEAFGQGLPCLGVVDLWSLDVPRPREESAATAAADDPPTLGCASALHLTQALLKADWPERGMPRLWLVTRNAQPVMPSTDPLAVAQAPVWGLGNTIALEHPELRCTLLDLSFGAEPGDIEQVAAELQAGGQEGRVAFRHGARHVARLARVAYDGEPDPFKKPAQRLEITARGTFDSLAMRPAVRRPPGAGEVEVEVYASGLNFRDVMNVLAMRDDPEPLGSECSGRVARVGAGVSDLKRGDAIIAIAPGSFGTFVTTRAELVVPKPDPLSFEEAATLPLAFLTAHYALDRVAQVTSADRVLIHAAAGGVGLAAVQLAQRAGAEIFATAGSPAKRAYLKSIGVQHVMDSRSLDFAGEITAIRPEGVSVVLNSLAGAFIPASLSVLADGGRFLEIGKRDIWSAQQVAELKPHARYTAIDLAAIISNDPGLARHLLLEVLACVQDGALKPLPLQTFPLADAANAFRYMAQARHIGKIVIAPQEREAVTQSEYFKSVTGRIHGDATYLITGGLGGLGLRVAEWLVEKGARHLVLAGRSGAPDEARAVIRGLELAGASVRVVQADVSQADQVAGMLAQIDTSLPPLRGVIHAAGVLDDGSILQQDWQRFRGVMAPKADGAWHLHALTRGLTLDFFVLFSSAASLLGSRGQANHAAANAFLDALAHFRAACGLPALAINWGAWSEIGAAALRGVTHRAVAQGVGIIDPQQGIRILEQVIRTGFAQIGVLPIDWPVFVRQFATGSVPAFLSDLAGPAAITVAERPGRPPAKQAGAEDHAEWAHRLAQAAPNRRRALLLAYVQEQVGKVLGAKPAQLREHVALSELGLDSLMAIELRNLLSQNLGLPRALPATLVFDYPSVGALADYLDREILPPLIAELAPEQDTAGAPQIPREVAAAHDAASGMLGALEELSDEEVDRLFEEKMTGKAAGSRG